MADEDHRDTALLLQAFEHMGLMDAAAPIERRKRLIEQQQIRLGQQRPPQCHPLALTAREGMSRLPQQIGKAESRRQRFGLPAPSPLAGRQLQIAEHRQMGEEARVLKNQSDPARFGQQLSILPIAPKQAILVLAIEPGDDAQQGALAAAGGAKQAEDPTQFEGQCAVEGKRAKLASGMEVQGMAVRHVHRRHSGGLVHPNTLRCLRCNTP